MKHQMHIAFDWRDFRWHTWCSGWCPEIDIEWRWYEFLDAWEAYRKW